MPPNLDSIRERYFAQFGFELLVTDGQGQITHGHFEPTDCECGGRSDKRRLHAAEQTRYWGETVINTCCDDGYAMWAVPILNNNELTGSLLV